MRASAAQSLDQCTPAALAGPPAKDQSVPLGRPSADDGESAALGGWLDQDRPAARAADGLDAGVLDLGAPEAVGPAGAPDVAGPDVAGPDVAAGEPGSRATSEFFYPAALRLLGVRRRASGSADCAGRLVQRIEVALGDY